MYETVEEAENRLLRTVVSYEGLPVHVTGIHRPRSRPVVVTFQYLPSGVEDQKEVTDKGFNRFQTVPLGFLNYFESGITQAGFCERVPTRTRQQGLVGANFRAECLKTGYRLDFEQTFRSEAFFEMVTGEYPTFDTALGMLSPNTSMGVSREFAVSMSDNSYIFLHHKREEIAIIIRGQTFIQPSRQYLIETILEEPNLPNDIQVM